MSAFQLTSFVGIPLVVMVYGALVLVAGLVFRAKFRAIRGNDGTSAVDADPDVTLAEAGDA